MPVSDETYVPEKVCIQVHRSIEKLLETGERRMNSHGVDITDLKIIMAQLTQLQTTNTAALAAMEARVRELETNRHEHVENEHIENEHNDSVRSPPNETFLDRPSGQLIIKGTFFLLGIIVLAAIGQNVSPEFLAKLF